MRSILALGLLPCALISTTAAAEEGDSAPASEKVLTGPAPEWAKVPDLMPVPDTPRGVIFVREWDTEAHLDADGETSFQSYRVRLLQANALQLGNISISWNPAAGAPVVHWLRVHRNGIVRDVMAEAEFDILRREDHLEESMISGVLTAVLRVPDLRIGDELDVAYSIRQRDPTLGPDSAGILFLSQSPSPGRFRLRLSWDKGQKPDLKVSPDLDAIATRSANSLEINADMPQPANPPKDAPPRYNWMRVAQYSDFRSWQAISQRLEPLYEKAATLESGSPLKQEAVRIAAAHKDPLEQASAALKLVQQQVRYIYVGLNAGNLTPIAADETWRRRYGDCKGKTVLLMALLNELGIDAQPVLADNSGADDGMNLRLPNPALFDHVLVRAKIAGKTYWLDGTMPDVVPPQLRPSLPYRWVLPLAKDGASLAEVPWQPMERPDTLVLYEIDARDGFEQPAKIEMTTITRGIDGLLEYQRYSSVTDEQLLNAYRQNAEGGNTFNEIQAVSWKFDVPTQASVLTVVGNGPVDWDDESNNGRHLTLPGGGFSPPERRQRGRDQDQDAPYYTKPEFDCRVTTVRLPSDTKTSDWSYNSTFDRVLFGEVYRRAFERRDGEITMLREARVLNPEISTAIASAGNANLTDFDNSMAKIVYYPNDPTSLRMSETLPPTYSHDWLHDDTACRLPLNKDTKGE